MKPRLLSELAATCGGTLSGSDVEVTSFATDSRQVQPGSLFLAIKGEKVDGHDFAAKAIASGAAGVLCERPVEGTHILVDNLVQALAKLGAHERDQFSGPVVGITGSAGKTTTKEFLAAALSSLGEILKSPGNRNTEYTSPLVWFEKSDDTKVAVIEMAMRGFGQITHLASISRPNIGLITNIGYSHLLQIESRDGIAKAKGELLEALPADGLGIVWADDDYLEVLKAKHPNIKTFGFSSDADSVITDYKAHDWSTSFVSGKIGDKKWKAKLPAVGRHLAANAAAAVLVASELGIEPFEAARCISQATLPPMRMETRSYNGATIILDTYNASPSSMLAAIEAVGSIAARGHRLAVLGEMKELGDHTEAAHRKVGEAVATFGLDSVLFIGEPMKLAMEQAIASGVSPSKLRYTDSIDDVREFLRGLRMNNAALVKGSRALELERALEGLV